MNVGDFVSIIIPQYPFDTKGDLAKILKCNKDTLVLERLCAFNGTAFSYPLDAVSLYKEEDTKIAAKNDKKDCKPDYSLIPKVFMDQLSYCMMAGEIKYGRHNYTGGHKICQLTAAASRHLKHIESQEDIDVDTTRRLQEVYGSKAPEIHHWACVAASALMALHQMSLGTQIDDRFKKRKE